MPGPLRKQLLVKGAGLRHPPLPRGARRGGVLHTPAGTGHSSARPSLGGQAEGVAPVRTVSSPDKQTSKGTVPEE